MATTAGMPRMEMLQQADMVAQIEPRIRGFSSPEKQSAALATDAAIAPAVSSTASQSPTSRIGGFNVAWNA